MRAKSLNEISAQRDLLKELDKLLKNRDGYAVGEYRRQLCRYRERCSRLSPKCGSSRIAAYHLGFEFVGIEIDPDYFAAQNERFDRECCGVIATADGSQIVQQNLFE